MSGGTNPSRGWRAPRGLAAAVALTGVLAGCPGASSEADAGPRPAGPADPWDPGESRASARAPNPRGLLDRKGLIHAHSVFSHDACDGEPVDDAGVRNRPCYEDFREGLCQTRQDFVMLTDHSSDFDTADFDEAVLFDASLGDALVARDGVTVANRLRCPGGDEVLVMAGSEGGGFMFVGIENHLPLDGRKEAYASTTDEGAARLRAQGAVLLVSHTERFTADALLALDLDGYEMFNMHANLLTNTSTVLDYFLRIENDFAGFPQSDLIAARVITEDPRYLDTWAEVAASGARRVTTMGSDCHRNTFPGLLPDGERMDSYRRMMAWFTNHLLVRPNDDGGFDDLGLKEALREGRLYGAFEVLGAPEGFDYVARAGDAVVEMGGEIALTDGPTLEVRRPSVRDLDLSAREAPVMLQRILRATPDGWIEVASGEGDLEYAPEEVGAYRAEVRITPYHLRADLGDDDIFVLREPRIWIYANPIYVR